MPAPTLAELHKLEGPGPIDWQRWTPTQKKRETERLIGRILDAIDAENREPDLWERFHLAQAINLSHLGWHDVAHVDARFALIPRDQISPNAVVPPLPELEIVTLPWLRQQLQTLTHQPTMLHGRQADPDDE
jgi:hypothetical protein